MSNGLEVSDLALVIPGNGANLVRSEPEIPEIRNQNVIGSIPEHAVLAILPEPADWKKPYPHNDGRHRWFWVRGRSDKKERDGRFKIVTGWTAANKSGTVYLKRMSANHACLDAMGTAFDTHQNSGQQAYVLPADTLNVRKESDLHSQRIGRLRAGTVITVTGRPECDTKMVWWRVEPLSAPGPKGWVGEGGYNEVQDYFEWYLVPLTLK